MTMNNFMMSLQDITINKGLRNDTDRLNIVRIKALVRELKTMALQVTSISRVKIMKEMIQKFLRLWIRMKKEN